MSEAGLLELITALNVFLDWTAEVCFMSRIKNQALGLC